MTPPDPLAPPPALRDALRADLRPVQPLRPPFERALRLVPLVAATLVCAVLVFSLRPDAPVLGWALTWGASVAQGLVGAWLIALGLRDAVPGRELRPRLLFTAVAILLGFSAGLTLETWHVSPIGIRRTWALITTECFVGTWVTALPLLFGAVVLVSRAYPTRPWSAGLLAGLGAGAAADAGWRLFCHFTTPAHVLLSHTAGMLLAGLAGALLANAMQRNTRAEKHER
jgi:hypothetical protein